MNPLDYWILEPNTEDPRYTSIMESFRKIPEYSKIEKLSNFNPGRFLGEIAAKHFGYPSSKLKVIGVTGTNGKTSSVAMARHFILSRGHKVCEIGTLGLKLWLPENQKAPLFSIDTGFTTPDAPLLQDIFFQLLKTGFEYVVMEVSSHACTLGRIGGTFFSGAVFTNITQDHLDFHKTMEAYENAKASFFTDYLVNPVKDVERIQEWKPCFGVSLMKSQGSQLVVHNILPKLKKDLQISVFEFSKIHFVSKDVNSISFRYGEKATQIQLPLIGDFQVENFLGVFGLLGGGAELANAIRTFPGVPGRMQRVQVSEVLGPAVFVDYAHTPDALERSLSTLADLRKNDEKIHLVFGCGGDRDKSKRPLMAKVAEKYADKIFVTSDNPRNESPEAIIDDIFKGFQFPEKVVRCQQRDVAIVEAIRGMKAADLCLIAGKGHESYQIIGEKKLDFSDYEVAEKTLKDSG